jgi:hypothetical protein
MNKLVLTVLCCMCSIACVFSQDNTAHNVAIEIENNAFMCPNLTMKINRTLIQRQSQISNWVVASDYNSATFSTTNASLCNKDSIVKIFVKESEYPYHIINSIHVDGIEIYKKGSTNH